MTDKHIADLKDKEIADFVRDIVASTTINRRDDEHKTTFDIPIEHFPLVALERFIVYGAQRVFNDAIGGSDKSPESKIETVGRMIDEYQAGTISKKRASSAPTTNLQTVARQLARTALRTVYAADSGLDFKSFTDLDRLAQNEKLDKIIEGNDKLLKQAQQKIDDAKTATVGISLSDLNLT